MSLVSILHAQVSFSDVYLLANIADILINNLGNFTAKFWFVCFTDPASGIVYGNEPGLSKVSDLRGTGNDQFYINFNQKFPEDFRDFVGYKRYFENGSGVCVPNDFILRWKDDGCFEAALQETVLISHVRQKVIHAFKRDIGIFF